MLPSTVRRFSLAVLAGLAALGVQAQPAFLVKDINTDQPAQGIWDVSLEGEGAGGRFYFVLDDGVQGNEAWVSDGTAAGSHLVRDICPGACSSNPRNLTASNGLLFFVADDPQRGPQLWRTDGTPEGTAALADLYPGLQGFVRFPLMDAGGRLFFTARDDDHGMELWVTDGTADGTRLVRDVAPGPASSAPRPLAAGNGQLLFAADAGHGLEPWMSDGTEAGTRSLGDLRPGPDPSIASLAPDNGRDAVAAPWGGFVFVADDGAQGAELWRTDGTPGGTYLLRDVASGLAGSSPYGLTAANGRIVFAADDFTHGPSIWSTDGTAGGTLLLQSGPGLSPLELTAVGARVFFRGFDAVHGEELWVTDGTLAGTRRVKDVNPGFVSAFPLDWGRYGLSSLGGRLVFFAQGSSGIGLWESDGTDAGTRPVAPQFGGWPYPISIEMQDGFGVAGGRLFFRAGTLGGELWSADGTAAGPVQVKSFPLPTSAFQLYGGKLLPTDSLADLGGTLFFQATNGHTRGELWRSDGTPGGTLQLSQGASYVFQLHAAGGKMFYQSGPGLGVSDGTPAGTRTVQNGSVAEIGTLGGQLFTLFQPTGGTPGLWQSDGTGDGTVLVSALDGLWTPAMMTASGGKLFYRENGGAGSELWVSDGTAPGTFPIDIYPGAGSSDPTNLIDAGGTLFFSAAVPGHGEELWKSDGTPAGTVMVKDIQPGTGNSIPFSFNAFAVAGGTVFFAADDGESGLELWKSDGTTAGTVQVSDIRPGSASSSPHALTALGNKVYFVADDGLHGQELWVSDGTGEGTSLVRDLVPGPGSSFPDNLAAAGPVLVFSAYDDAHGVEPWRSDGTAIGTRRIQDIAPGPLSSSPTAFTVSGANVYFVANDNATGFELWRVPETSVLSTFADVPTDFWAWSYIEALAAAGLTTGCAPGQYCPGSLVTRAEIAAFLERGLHGPEFVPPAATGTVFTDVPAGFWAAGWIEQLAADHITTGCAPNQFCPSLPVNRAEMAVFLLRARHGGAYMPPPVASTRFTDVPADFWAAAWIEQLAVEGITTGCAPNQYCPGDSVGRDQMAAFLARTFQLTLP